MNTEYWRISLEEADEVGCYDILKSIGEENLNNISKDYPSVLM